MKRSTRTPGIPTQIPLGYQKVLSFVWDLPQFSVRLIWDLGSEILETSLILLGSILTDHWKFPEVLSEFFGRVFTCLFLTFSFTSSFFHRIPVFLFSSSASSSPPLSPLRGVCGNVVTCRANEALRIALAKQFSFVFARWSKQRNTSRCRFVLAVERCGSVFI